MSHKRINVRFLVYIMEIICLQLALPSPFQGLFYVVELGDIQYKGAKEREVIYLQLCF